MIRDHGDSKYTLRGMVMIVLCVLRMTGKSWSFSGTLCAVGVCVLLLVCDW